ncbi:hypothetical protein [Streptomyces sp. NPDC056549]|uniref:hypothetical protein n=1 Tax=Streptomyces sp. NPDC056549 TaxID=3345864 RepID=UPI003694DC0B
MQNIGIFVNPCFTTNRTKDSHLSYDHLTSSVEQEVRYEFNYGYGYGYGHGSSSLRNGSKCQGSTGSRYSVMSNAARPSNGDSRSHRIFYISNQQGTDQTIDSGASENLIAALKNENATSARL